MTEDWIPITAKFHSACLECMGDIEAGDQILWLKGKGTKHKVCPEAIEQTHEVEIEEDYSTWKDQKVYSYKEVREITICQKCGNDLTRIIGPKFIDTSQTGDRRVCEVCFDG